MRVMPVSPRTAKFNALWDHDMACALRAEGVGAPEIARLFGVSERAAFNKVRHVECPVDQRRVAARETGELHRQRAAARRAPKVERVRLLRAADMAWVDIAAVAGLDRRVCQKLAKGVKPKGARGKRVAALKAKPKPIIFAVPTWAESAGLGRDYRDFCRDFGEHHAARECRRLKAEAARACL